MSNDRFVSAAQTPGAPFETHLLIPANLPGGFSGGAPGA